MATEPPDTETDRELASLKQEKPDEETTGRRGFLTALATAGMAVAGLVGYSAGTAEAATPSGDVGNPTEPFEIAYADRIVFNERTTDPSSPADGTLWYNSSA